MITYQMQFHYNIKFQYRKILGISVVGTDYSHPQHSFRRAE